MVENWHFSFIMKIVLAISLLIIKTAYGNELDRRQSLPSATSLDITDDLVFPRISQNNITSKPTSENKTAQLGTSVFLGCRTHHSMERQVSWVRRRDWHILTSGTIAYTKEQRFRVHHPEGSTEWTLEIKYIQIDDEGTYECQIATGGGFLSHLVHLNVVTPVAVIPGNGEHHVETSSTITLDCIIEQSPIPPQFIFWFQKDRMINYDTERGGVMVNIDTSSSPVRSRLTIMDALPSDSGNYTCTAANAKPASVMVYITEANKIAVIQPKPSDGGENIFPVVSAVTFISLLSVYHSLSFILSLIVL